MGLKRQLFKNRASLTLTASDVFHTYRVKYIITSNELGQTTLGKRKAPIVSLGFIWRFNGHSSKEKWEYEGAVKPLL